MIEIRHYLTASGEDIFEQWLGLAERYEDRSEDCRKSRPARRRQFWRLQATEERNLGTAN